MKVLFILIDGVRPDALKNLPPVQEVIKKGSYTFAGRTVTPSVTLPCHMSLFHSVDPSRHGTTTNTYMPQVRPVKGLCEVLLENKKKSAFFYDWEELRDIARPDSLTFSYFCKGKDLTFEKTHTLLKDQALAYLAEYDTDFTFLYTGYTDVRGHKFGWMSDEYLEAVRECWEEIEQIIHALPEEYTIIITSDHGGHERMHGTELEEDMVIPFFMIGKGIEAGKQIENMNIKDIAPTIAKLLDVEPNEEWEGKSLI